MPAAPALSPHAPADKLQALGPCLGSDSGWEVEATLEPSLAGSRDHVRVPIVTGLTALHGSWGKKGLRSLGFLFLLPMDLPSSGRCVRDGAWAWAQQECPLTLVNLKAEGEQLRLGRGLSDPSGQELCVQKLPPSRGDPQSQILRWKLP